MNTLTIDIRAALPHDAPAIADIHQQAWYGAYSGIIPHKSLNAMINRRGSKWWKHAIQRATSVILIEFGGIIAGYATVGRNRARQLPQEGEIYELYLRPEYQGVGLGSRLFAAAREALAERNLNGLVVWALADNHGALSFYDGLGGHEIAEGAETFDGKSLQKIAFIWD